MQKLCQGRFSEKLGAACEVCPRGWMQPEIGQSSCIRPKVDQIVADGKSSAIDIAEGWRRSDCLSGSTLCESMARCRAGTVGRNNRSACDKCAPGKTSFAGAMPPCRACEPGKFAGELGSSECKPCLDRVSRPRGYSDEAGQHSCKTCSHSCFAQV